MNYNYCETNFQRSQSGRERVSSPPRFRTHENFSNYRSMDRYYPTEVVEQSSIYYIKRQNSELKSTLYEEIRQNEEVSKKLKDKINELETIGKKLKNKTEEFDSFQISYNQSEQIRQEQAKLIESMKAEIEVIKKKLEKDEVDTDELKSEVSSKAGGTKSKAKPGDTARSEKQKDQKGSSSKNLKVTQTSNNKQSK